MEYQETMPTVFKIGSVQHFRLGKGPGLIEVIGTQIKNPQPREGGIRIPYVVKIGVRTPSWDGKSKFTNQAHMYRWYDFIDVEVGKKGSAKVPKTAIKESLDFMLFEAAAAYNKMGYAYEFKEGGDCSDLVDYVAARLVRHSRGLLEG